MSISLNKPTTGTPNWASLINANWTTIESCLNGGTGFGPIDLSEGQINNLRIQNVGALPGAPNVPGRLIYLTTDNTLYFNNGTTWGTIGGGAGAHNFLSTSHTDSAASAAVRGGIAIVDATPQWTQLAVGAMGKILRSDGTDLLYSTFNIASTFAAGDLIHASSTDSLTALAIGTTEFFLKSNGTLPTWFDLFGTANSWTVTQNFTAGMNVTAGQNIDLAGGSGAYYLTRNVGGDIEFYTNSVLNFKITVGGNIVCGVESALATDATSGFLYVPSSAGTPTGDITDYTGKVGIEFDTTNRLPYYNDGAATNPWRFVRVGNGVALTDEAPVTLTVTSAYLHTLTATTDRTINASGTGIFGQDIEVQIQSDAAAARTITFGTNFKANGTIVTPATAGKIVSITFTSDGTTWNESGRQTGGV